MTGKELAELRAKLGITRQVVAKIESGENNMRKSVAMLAGQLVKES